MTTQRMDRALERFRQGEAALYDGEKRLWSDEEHERRYDAFLAEFDEEKDSAIAEADREIEKAERTLALEHRDLSDSLTNEELERANAKRSYIEDDVWSLDLETLAKRVRAAQVGGDKPTMFLYARTLGRRVETEYEADNVDMQSAQYIRELEDLAGELTQTVRGPEHERDLERARKAKRDATSAKFYAGELRRRADGTEDRQYREAVERTRSLL